MRQSRTRGRLGDMASFWKGLVVVLLTLPVGAYVTGSLVGSQADLPDRRAPVVIDDPQTTPPSPTSKSTGRPDSSDRPTATPDAPPPSSSPGGSSNDSDGSGSDDGGKDGEVQVIRPEPDDLDDRDGDDDGDGDDDSGDDRETDDD